MSTSPSPPPPPPPRPSTSMSEVKATWEAGQNDIQHFTTLKPLVNHDNYIYWSSLVEKSLHLTDVYDIVVDGIPKPSDPKSTKYANWVKKDNHAQECLSTLKKLDFDVPSYLEAALLLATLPANPKDSQSWYSFIHAQSVNKETKLSDIVSSIHEATRADAAIAPQSGSAVKSALATLERDAREKGGYWCTKCRKGGHTKSYCTEPGGGRAGKKNKKKGKGGKGKEKAHAAEDSGGEKVSNVVLADLDLALNNASFHYDASTVNSPSTHPHSTASDEVYLASTSSGSKSFIIDSSSSTHLHSSRSDFATYSATPGVITGVGQGKLPIVGQGEAHIPAKSKAGHSSKVKLKHTAFVPDASASLISVARMDEDGCYTIFGNGKSLCFQLNDSGELLRHLSASENVVFTGTKNRQHLYTLDSPDSSTLDVVFLTCKYASTLEELHAKLAHLSYSILIPILKAGLIDGVKILDKELNSQPPICEPCIKGKMMWISFHSRKERCTEFLGLVHSDLWEAPIISHNGNRYVITFNNDSSGTHWSYFLKRKTANEVSSMIKEWIWKIEHLTGQKLKRFHSDGGGEYVNASLHDWFQLKGITFTWTSAHTPEQNGVSERFNRTSAGLVCTMLINSKLPPFLWNEAWCYAGYCLNRAMQGLNRLKGMTAHQILTGSKAHGCDFHSFGCKAYVYVHESVHNKLEPRAEVGFFVGFDRNQKAYRVYLPGKRTVVTSIHVKFDNSSFSDAPIGDKGEHKQLYDMFTGLQSNNADSVSIDNDSIDTPSAPSASPSASDPVKPPPSPVPTPSAPKLEQPSTPTPSPSSPLPAQHPKAMPKSWPDPSVPPLRTHHAAAKEATASSGGDAQPETSHAAVLSVGDNPQTLAQALNSPERKYWVEAIEEELRHLAGTETYELVPCPESRKPTGTKWVFNIKRNEQGHIVEHHARLVAQGFSQIPGVDFWDTYVLVARIESIHAISGLAATLNWEIHVVDVKSAFLNSEIPVDQPAYVAQPPGYVVKGKKNCVWLLHKALYGLRQSAFLWYQKLKEILITLGFKPCLSDPCVFSILDEFKSNLSKHVVISDKGEISQLLGMTVTRDRPAPTISFNQSLYIDSIVERFGLGSAHPSSTPIVHGTKLSKTQSPTTLEEQSMMAKVPYQSAVGSIMHAAVMTRPDISHACQCVAQFMQNPGEAHWTTVKQIIWYLKSTRNLSLTLGGASKSFDVTAWSDSDFAGHPDHGRSVSGYALFLGRGCFSWRSRKQTATASSTSEAEYYAAHLCGREVIWFHQLMEQIGFPLEAPTPFHVDSQAAIANMNSEQINGSNKHVKVSYHWIREAVIKDQHIVTVNVPL
ncbi:gag-pol polyprotein [Moniliophthora roreri MCA 2997]|uniref:Gag-pol polyprotein n=1 Tax=Moniliophthora roreri (strain MCA 2997) TaxID=1381753 RepID=V2XQZ8_MONRO|nr:gag-pol polyprotein [Moniliophthora roreri MCA 2997]